MTDSSSPHIETTIRTTLADFWSEALEIGATPRGYSLALPQTLPDGWQLIVDLESPLPRGIRLDYYIPNPVPAAFHTIRRHGRIIDSMEQWGFRWHDLRAKYPSLRPAMIYDPHHQEIDEDSRAIGEECCELFCSYEEVDRIHEFLG